MYEEYYGFVQPPFSLTPDPRFLYRSESHDVALQQVWQAIRRKEGFIVLTGDIGTGKTTLCRTVLEQFDQTTFTALILNPFLSVEELLREVLLSYGVVSRDALRTGRLATASKHELIRTLHDFLLSLVPLHGSAVLIIDEAQHLSTEVLEEIRILSNLETNEQKLLQIVLVGQLNLLDALHDAKLRQLDQRISIRCLLKPLNREEVEAYITHRLWVARGATAVTFSPRAVDIVHAITSGVPRMINLMCDRALMAASVARTAIISDVFIMEAATSLGLTVPRHVQRRDAVRRATGRWGRLAAILAVVVLIALVWLVSRTVGNPLRLLDDVAPLDVRAPQPAIMPGATAVPAPDSLTPLTPPPLANGAFSIVVGTYDTPRQATAVENTLRANKLAVYAVDLPLATGVRRRLLVGRFATREQAAAVHQSLLATFPNARVIPGELERTP
ncbi:MAG TPA: AAA family ATPase [Vicinamibacterales bacterium]|nr:AAA family ATPase [Vicinamibacterales bacterium]